jgi:predicted RNA-binding protein
MSDQMNESDPDANATEEVAPKEAGAAQPAKPARPKRKRKSGRSEGRSSQYWMIVSSPENFRKTREHGFTAQGIKVRHRRRVETMRQGDRVLYYVAGRMAFAATATVTSPMYEDHTPIWRTARREEDYPWRVRMRPDAVLEEADWVPAKDVAYRLEYVRKWPPEHWTLAFQGHLHQFAQKDFKLIEDEIRRTRRARATVSQPDPSAVLDK